MAVENNAPGIPTASTPNTIQHEPVAPIAQASPAASSNEDVSMLLSRLPAPEDTNFRREWKISSQVLADRENCVKCNSSDVVPVALILTVKSNNQAFAPDEHLLCKTCGHYYRRAKDEYQVGMTGFAILGILGILLTPLGIWIHANGHFMGLVAILLGVACLGAGVFYLRKALKAKTRANDAAPNSQTKSKQSFMGKLIGGAITVAAVVAIAFVINSLFSGSDGNGSPSLVGTWSNDMNTPFHYIFHENGAGIRGIAPLMESFTWSVESGNTVVMTFQAAVERWNFTIRGNRLEFTGNYLGPGEAYPFTRVATSALPPATVDTAQTGREEIPANIGGVNAETFAFIRDGMSIDEVRELIGVAPIYETGGEMFGVISKSIMWTEGATTITVGFTNGYVSSTQIMTLGGDTADDSIVQDQIAQDGWTTQTITSADFGVSITVSLPPEWFLFEASFSPEFGPGWLGIDSGAGDSNISFDDVFVGMGSTEALVASGTSSQAFMFDNMGAGFMIEFPDRTVWAPQDSWIGMILHHGGNRAIYASNADIIDAVARTFTVGTPQTVLPNAPQADELVGIWAIESVNLWHRDVFHFDQYSWMSLDADGTGELVVDVGGEWFAWHIEPSDFSASGYGLVLDFGQQLGNWFEIQDLASNRLVLYEVGQGNTYTFVRSE